MAHQFVLAFGGTGARCVEAFVYLAAAGVYRDNYRVLMIDPDQANGNVNEVLRQLGRYREINATLPAARADEPPCFATQLNAGLDTSSFFWQYPNANQSFATLISASALGREERDLLHLLYDSSDLDMSFEQGYVGRAHVGSLDLFRTLGAAVETAASLPSGASADGLQSFIRDLRSAAQSKEGAKLLVCGSIFGGTGASGLPAVPPLLKRVLADGLRDKLSIGCIQVAPYFSFPKGSEGAPDSALHGLATQSALYHYAHSKVGYDRVYMLGAPGAAPTSRENRLGGAAQRNAAHYVELGAALAAAHFFGDGVKDSEAGVFTSGARSLDWSELPSVDAADVRPKLVVLHALCWLHHHYLQDELRKGLHRGFKWQVDLERHTERGLGGQEDALAALGEFGGRLLQWTSDVNDGFGGRFLRNLAPATSALGDLADGGATDADAYHNVMAEFNRLPVARPPSPVGWYIETLATAVRHFCERNYSKWWR